MSPFPFPLVDVGDIVRLVGPTSYERGRVYSRTGAVRELDWDENARELWGTVLGSSPRPYRCRISLAPSPSKLGFHLPTASTCSCPMEFDCKHVAATLLEGNKSHLTSLNETSVQRASRLLEDEEWGLAGAATRPKSGQEQPARKRTKSEPSWKTAITALTAPAPVADPGRRSGYGGYGTASAPTTPMALQFELREETRRTRERWRGPTSEPVTPASLAARPAGLLTGKANAKVVRRLGVRPVILSSAGNWVRSNVTWASLAFQQNQLNLNVEQLSWFAQFGALHRAARTVYTGQDADWVYLDDFQSALLWHLFDEATALGIPFVGTKRNVTVTMGAAASLSLDASSAGVAGAATALAATTAPAKPARVKPADLRLTPALSIDGRRYPSATSGSIGNHGVYTYTFEPSTVYTLAPTPGPLTDEQRRLLAGGSTLVVPSRDVEVFLTDYYPRLRRGIQLTSSDETVDFPDIAPPVLVLTASFRPKRTLVIDWDWNYPLAGTPSGVRRPLAATDADRESRDEATELEILERVRHTVAPLTVVPTRDLQGLDAAEFTDKVLPQLDGLPGVRVDIVGEKPDYRELTEVPKLTIKTIETDQRDWFDLGVLVSIEGRDVPFGPLFTALAQGKKKLLLVDNSYLSLDQPVFDELHRLIDEASSLSEWETAPRISRYQSSLWSEFEDLAEETEQAVAWRESVTGLLTLTTVAPVPLPAGLRATLRPYQWDGFSWLVFLWQHQLGGILADDMGLGKTLQALALVAHAAENTPQTDRRPFLVVAPTSVVSNWVSEAARFTPGLTVRSVTATQAKSGLSFADVADGADIVVTSYALFRLDFDVYQAQQWAGLILDEAQFVKNHASKAHRCAVDFVAPVKIAVTGTPMENNLTELWSLFSIVAPGLFPSVRRFTEDYVRPIAAGESPELLPRLRRRIRPLMMRRTKELVARDLPAKQEQVLQIELAPRHKKLYDTYLQRERRKLLGLIDDIDKNRFIVFRSLTLLRMLSLDASLVDDKYADIPSSKLDALFGQLEDVIAEEHRALIFSQFTSFLQKAAARLDEMGIPYCYLDGSTLRRGEVIDRFKTGRDPVFLISLKAGGFGLNLTEADYVFLLDPWWNPATEAQAVDRTHRIGQTKNVMVYRLVSTGTIEEKVMALKEQKAKLFTSVMDDDEAVFSGSLTADDIRGLLDA
jgi:superfamily II DNA or RNA helicase